MWYKWIDGHPTPLSTSTSKLPAKRASEFFRVVEIDPKPHGTTAFGGVVAGETKGHTIWMNYTILKAFGEKRVTQMTRMKLTLD